jgi:very-short-patch-repair endonuclease
LHGHKFRRQAPIGPYIGDFVSFERKVVIEIDGGQHREQGVADEKRPAWLTSQGFRVLRFWNHEALANTDAVLAAIEQAFHTPTPTLPHQGGGG